MDFSHPYQFQNGQLGSTFTVRVTPRCSRNEVSGILQDGTVKIRLRKAPVEDQANQELIKYLAKIFEIPRVNLEIIMGNSQRKKVIGVVSLNPEQVQEKILKHIRSK